MGVGVGAQLGVGVGARASLDERRGYLQMSVIAHTEFVVCSLSNISFN